MKKLLLIFTLVLTTLLLFACGDKYDINFKDSEIVEMSSAEISTLLNEMEMGVEGQAASLLIEGSLDLIQDSSFDFGEFSYSSSVSISGTFSSQTYVIDSETVGDVALHSTSEVDATIAQSVNYNGEEQSSNSSIEGSLGVYFMNAFVYVNPEITMNEGGTETSISGKEKLNEAVTQAMWDEYMSEAGVVDEVGGMTPVDIPEELLALFDMNNMEDMIDAFPAVTVYQRGTITDVHFEINKDIVGDHLEDLLWVAYDKMVEAGEDVGTVAEATQDIADLMAEVNQYLDYFDELGLTLDIIMDSGVLARVAMEMVAVSNAAFESEMDASIDLSLSIISDYGVEMPNFPNDLDSYTPVDNIGDEFGSAIGMGSLLAMVVHSV